MVESPVELTMVKAIAAARGLTSDFKEAYRQEVMTHDCFGCCRSLSKPDMQCILTELIYKDCLAESHRTSARGWGVVYLVRGLNYQALQSHAIRITITKKKKAAPAKTPAKEAEAMPAATNDGLIDDGFGSEVSPRLSVEQYQALYKELLASRRMLQSIFSERASILTPEVMEEIARTVPLTEEELMTIDKMTPNSVKIFSGPILDFIKGWLKEKGIVVTKAFNSRGLMRRQQQMKMVPKNARGSRLALANADVLKKKEEAELLAAAEALESSGMLDEELLAAAEEVEKGMHVVGGASSFNPSTINQSSFNQSSVNQSSFNQSSVNQSSFNQSSYNQSSLNQSSLNQSSVNQSSYNQSSLNQSSLSLSSLTPPDSKRVSLSPSSFSSSSVSKYFPQESTGTPSQVSPTKRAMQLLGRKVVRKPDEITDLTGSSFLSE